MRDRLFDLIAEMLPEDVPIDYLPDVDAIVDHLLSAGVIVPKVKVGDTVYIPDDFGRIDAEIDRIEITESGLCYEWVKCDRGVDETEVWDDGSFEDADIGKTVFLSFEDYEKALAERNESV